MVPCPLLSYPFLVTSSVCRNKRWGIIGLSALASATETEERSPNDVATLALKSVLTQHQNQGKQPWGILLVGGEPVHVPWCQCSAAPKLTNPWLISSGAMPANVSVLPSDPHCHVCATQGCTLCCYQLPVHGQLWAVRVYMAQGVYGS